MMLKSLRLKKLNNLKKRAEARFFRLELSCKKSIMFLEKALTKGILMLVKLVFLFSLILWILNRYFPSRNAAIGLRFPTAFSSLKKWQQIQGEFYRLLILSNGVLLLSSCFYKINPLKLNALSLLTVLASGVLVLIKYNQ